MPTVNRLKTTIAIFTLPLFAACGKSAQTAQFANLASSSISSENDSGNTTGSTTVASKSAICSDLNFASVVFPSSLSNFSVDAFALGMNLTGSFEGHTGWDNISNNFDGQGLSLGLFNQNLGQGSLQPLLISLRDSQNSKFKSFFTSAQYSAISGMLTQWGGVANVLSKASPSKTYQKNYSDLDDLDAVAAADGDEVIDHSSLEDIFSKTTITKNQASVNWAVSNLYSGSSFLSAWQTPLQKMSRSPEYISLQVKAAETIHNKAKTYMNTYALNSLRAYLFFFDIVVQNGGITTSIQTLYTNWLKSNSSASENTKLKKLLEFRLTLVKSQYVNDVRTRKTAIIDGTGTVHGSKRDFPKEYCVGNWSIPYSEASLSLL